MALTPRQKKTAIWAGVALAAAALLVLPRLLGGEARPDGGGAGGAGGGPGRGGSDTLTVTVATVREEPLEDAFATTGTLLPDEEIEVRAEIGGRITQLGFAEGAAVRQGQTLAVLDSEVLTAQTRAAQTQADLARIQARRQRELFAIGGLSRAALDQAEAEAAVLQAGVAELAAETARRRVVAPFSGRIGLRSVSVGAVVAAGDALATLRKTDVLRLEFTVPERYLGRVGTGDAVSFTVPGRERTYRATVYAVEPGVSAETRAFTVRARAPNPAGELAPGGFAEVALVFDRVADALLVPSVSVVSGADSSAVFVVRNNVARRVAVTTGVRTADRVQITSGVARGDTVLTSGVDEARPGQAVRVVRGAFDPAGVEGPAATQERAPVYRSPGAPAN